MLAMALLAWATLAFGVPAMSPPAGQAPAMQSHARVKACTHGHDMAMAPSGSQHPHAPGMPAGHGDCCHGGCHCLSACSVVLLVPFVALGAAPAHRSPSVSGLVVGVVPATAAPPLRPPIA